MSTRLDTRTLCLAHQSSDTVTQCIDQHSQSGHRLGPLSIEQNKALATTPAEELLNLPFLQLEQIKDSLHAYQLWERS